MKPILVFSLAILTTPLSTAAFAGDVYVIANPASNLSAGDVKDVFLGDKQIDGSMKLTPIDNAAMKADFTDKVLHVTVDKYTAVWVKKGFRDGLNPPQQKTSDNDVIATVKSKPGAVGYVSDAPPADVKLIKKY